MQLVATVLDGTVLEGFSPTLPQGSFTAISLPLKPRNFFNQFFLKLQSQATS